MPAPVGRDWGTFGQVVGDASGALVGLLFVAVSLNRERIVKHKVLCASMVQTLLVLMLPLLVAILLTTPRQGPPVLGCEFIFLVYFQTLLTSLPYAGSENTKRQCRRSPRAASRRTSSSTSHLTTTQDATERALCLFAYSKEIHADSKQTVRRSSRMMFATLLG
jgi:hypothetical protein